MTTVPIITDADQPCEDWRPGVATRMLVSAANGSSQLCIFEQWCEPGLGAPLHYHAVEEVLTVVDGMARVEIGPSRLTMHAGQSVVVPAGIRHGFSNISDTRLHVRAILASPVFEAAYDDMRETPRRWLPAAAAAISDP